TGAEIVVVPVRVVEVGRRAGHAIGAALARTIAHLVVEADGAAAAREEVEIRHAIALAQRLTHGVHGDARAQPLHPPAHLVAEGEILRARPIRLLHLPAPDVQIGAAHARARELHEDGARLDLRHRVFPQIELATVRTQHRYASLHLDAPSLMAGGPGTRKRSRGFGAEDHPARQPRRPRSLA